MFIDGTYYKDKIEKGLRGLDNPNNQGLIRSADTGFNSTMSSSEASNARRAAKAGFSGSMSSSDIANARRASEAGIPTVGGHQLPMSSSQIGSYGIGQERFERDPFSSYGESYTGNPLDFYDVGHDRTSSIERSAARQMEERMNEDDDYSARLNEKGLDRFGNFTDPRLRNIYARRKRNPFKMKASGSIGIPWKKYSSIRAYGA